MNLGISTSCFYPLLTEKSLELLGKNGIKTTEVFFNATSELSKDFVKELKKIKDYYGMSINSVHPTMSLAESFMLFSAYDRRKEEGLEDFKRYGEICSELGAKYIILHGGKPNGVLSDTEYFERFAEISAVSKQTGGILLQENVAKFRAGNIDFLKKMSEYLGSDAAFCLDVKQCIRGGYSPFDALSLLKNGVKHLHLSDHNNTKDCLPPSKGNFDFYEFLLSAEKLHFTGTSVIEVYRDSFKDETDLFNSFYWLENVYDKILKTLEKS